MATVNRQVDWQPLDDSEKAGAVTAIPAHRSFSVCSFHIKKPSILANVRAYGFVHLHAGTHVRTATSCSLGC